MTTRQPPPDSAKPSELEALKATVESALWQGAELAGNVSDTNYDDLVEAKEAFRDYVAAVEAREQRYRAFVERVATASEARNVQLGLANGEDEVSDASSAYIHTLDNVGREAWKLLEVVEGIETKKTSPTDR